MGGRTARTDLPDNLAERSGHVTPDAKLWVDDQPGGQAVVGQLHGDRINQERHVVGNDVDHVGTAIEGGVAAVPDLNQCASLRPLGGEISVPDGDRCQPSRTGRCQVIVGHVPVICRQVVGQVTGARHRTGQAGSLEQQVRHGVRARPVLALDVRALDVCAPVVRILHVGVSPVACLDVSWTVRHEIPLP